MRAPRRRRRERRLCQGGGWRPAAEPGVSMDAEMQASLCYCAPAPSLPLDLGAQNRG